MHGSSGHLSDLARFSLLYALVRPPLCSIEQLATTSKLGGIRQAAKQFLFLGIAVTKLQPPGQLTPPERSHRTRLTLTACVSEEHMHLGCVCMCVTLSVFVSHVWSEGDKA